MKFKMFRAEDSDTIVREVNQWVSAEPARIAIRHTETRLTPTDATTGAAVLLFSVWYEEEA
ncbi:MAG: hypothetical protein JF627_00530 [Alphaproteobacteria bacterium]|nr:hypothetical protein [Alphaproteobacteria bacterium]